MLTVVTAVLLSFAADIAAPHDVAAEDRKRAAEQQAIYDKHRAAVKAAGVDIPKDADVFDYQLVDSFPKVVLHVTLVHDHGVEVLGYSASGKHQKEIGNARAALETRGWSKADAKTREQMALDWATDVVVRNSGFRSGAKKPPVAKTGADGKITITGEIEVQHRSGPWGQNLDSTTFEPRVVVFAKDGRVE